MIRQLRLTPAQRYLFGSRPYVRCFAGLPTPVPPPHTRPPKHSAFPKSEDIPILQKQKFGLGNQQSPKQSSPGPVNKVEIKEIKNTEIKNDSKGSGGPTNSGGPKPKKPYLRKFLTFLTLDVLASIIGAVYLWNEHPELRDWVIEKNPEAAREMEWMSNRLTPIWRQLTEYIGQLTGNKEDKVVVDSKQIDSPTAISSALSNLLHSRPTDTLNSRPTDTLNSRPTDTTKAPPSDRKESSESSKDGLHNDDKSRSVTTSASSDARHNLQAEIAHVQQMDEDMETLMDEHLTSPAEAQRIPPVMNPADTLLKESDTPKEADEEKWMSDEQPQIPLLQVELIGDKPQHSEQTEQQLERHSEQQPKAEQPVNQKELEKQEKAEDIEEETSGIFLSDAELLEELSRAIDAKRVGMKMEEMNETESEETKEGMKKVSSTQSVEAKAVLESALSDESLTTLLAQSSNSRPTDTVQLMRDAIQLLETAHAEKENLLRKNFEMELEERRQDWNRITDELLDETERELTKHFDTESEAAFKKLEADFAAERRVDLMNLARLDGQAKALEMELISYLSQIRQMASQNRRVHSLLSIERCLATKQPIGPAVQELQKVAVDDDFIQLVIESLPLQMVQQIQSTPVASPDELKKSFESVHRDALQAAFVPESGGLMGHLKAALHRILFTTTGYIYATEDNGPARLEFCPKRTVALLQRALFYCQHGNFEDCYEILSSCKGLPRSVAQDWMRQVELMLTIQTAVEAFRARLRLQDASLLPA